VEARNSPKHEILGQAKQIQIIQIKMFKTLAFMPENGVFRRRKTVIFCHLYSKMFKNLSFMMQNNAFLVPPHQITASAYLVRDDAGLR